MAVLEGANSGNLAEVDEHNNLLVNLPTDDAQAGVVRILDSDGREISVTENGALNTSLDGIVLVDQVDGVALNTNVWSTAVSTMTVSQASGFITLNAASSVAAAAYAVLSSVKSIPLYGYLPLRVAFNAYVTIQPEANATIEVGIGKVATNAAPTDGAFFRWNASSELRCVINNGGVEIQSSPVLPPPATGDMVLLEIVIVEDAVQFYIDDDMVAEVQVATGQAYPTNSGRLPVFARVFNGGSSPAIAPTLNIGQVIVTQQAMNQNKTWSDTLASLGRGAYQSPVTPFGQNPNHTNSTSPASGALSNTTPAYATLGGRYQFAAPVGAATDYALFGFQVPAGFQLYISAIAISLMNTGAIGGLTGTQLDWSLAVNASAASLATADAAGTTWAPRRIPLGVQSLPISAVIGAQAGDIVRAFPSSVVCDAGRYVHVIVQIPVGLATASQVLRGDVMINGYFE